ncbi:MAG: HtaA domain-containing protein [Actinomycetota bacterium]|nr:HtaA domain-containing protein [Actinomycetota bacterium]
MRDALALALASMVGIVPSAVPEDACSVEDVSITWGFKESFRSYISSSIANGSWEVSGDVGYEIPEFTFTGGSGFLTPDRSLGEVGFTGGIVFSGHDGILETSLQNPELVVTGPREATLVLDVTGDTMEEVSVNQPNVDFASVTWDGSLETVDVDQGVWRVVDAEVTLTQEGSEAFGTYPAGEMLDPMSFTLSLTPGCLEEAGPSIWWIPGGVVAIAAGLSALALAIRRGRK